MVAEGPDNAGGQLTPVTPGGGTYRSLDLNDTRDAGLLRQAVKKWPRRFARMNAEAQEELAGAVVEATRIARGFLTDPAKSMDAIDRVAKLGSVGVSMVKIQQADDHAEAGVGETNANTLIVIQAPPRVRME